MNFIAVRSNAGSSFQNLIYVDTHTFTDTRRKIKIIGSYVAQIKHFHLLVKSYNVPHDLYSLCFNSSVIDITIKSAGINSSIIQEMFSLMPRFLRWLFTLYVIKPHLHSVRSAYSHFAKTDCFS